MDVLYPLIGCSSVAKLERTNHLTLLYNQLNNTSPEKNNDPVNVANSK